MSLNTRNTYLHALVKEWCRRESLPMYELGGAHNCTPGYIPVDKNEKVKTHPQGIYGDVFTLKDCLVPNSVGCFRAHDFLEHIPIADIPRLMNLLYDLLVPGGFLLTMTPTVCDDNGRCGRGAFMDPTHISYWSSNNFWYFTKLDFAQFVPELYCRFQQVRLFNYYPSKWCHTHLIPYVCADLVALKDKRSWPGQIEI